ncbi:MAG: hypothetical protein AAFX55_12775 [Bacteroidota bacterium]
MLSFMGYTQNAEDVFDSFINAKKSDIEYQVNINYALYNGKSGKTAYENYNGVQAKYNGVFYQKLKLTEFILGEDFLVKLNPEERAMLVGYSSNTIITNPNHIDNTEILRTFENKTLEDLKDQWKLVLSQPKTSSLLEFSTVELYIKKDSYNLNKQVIFYSYIADFSVYSNHKGETPQKGNPRLDIIFTDYQDTISLEKEKFRRSNYFIYKNDKIFPSKNYEDYEIIFANQ